MKWFKHYENAHTNQFIQALLMDKNGHKLHSIYWLLLEFLCGEFKKDTTVFTASARQLKEALHIGQNAKIREVLGKFAETSGKFDESLLKVSETSGNFWKIETPIILELMGKSFKRKRHSGGSDTPKKEEKRKKNKNIPQETADAASVVDLVAEDWNKLCKVLTEEDGIRLPSVKIPLSDARKKRVKIMLKDLPDREQWKKAMGMIPANKFNIGHNDRGWVANFDWFLNTNQNYLKLYEAWCLANED